MVLRPKSRLRRFLGFKSRSDVGIGEDECADDADSKRSSVTKALSFTDDDEFEPGATDASSTSSGIVSSGDTTLDSCDGASYSSSEAGGDDSEPPASPEPDPFEDVRERMELLAARDRARHAVHEAFDAGEDADGESAAYDVRHDTIPPFAAYTTYLGYAVLIVCGHIRDLLAKLFGGRYSRTRSGRQRSSAAVYPSDDIDVYAPLLKSWENFYTRRLYHRIQDCFNRPISSRPGASIDVLERVSNDGNKTMQLLGTLDDLQNDKQREVYEQQTLNFVKVADDRVARHCINLGSYNYLGFADDWDITCRKDVLGSITELPVSTSSSRAEFGTTALHRELEETVARFLGKEAALALNMGFNTNSTTIPALVGRGDLIISDELNHTSIVNGARGSGAAIRIFKHNDTKMLEGVLREAIITGQPRTRRPWNKILVIVEGIYSMEGEYCDLRNVVKVCKRYGAYVYLDEAHSIGAMGPTGRGCAEYCGVDTADIDIMMGTFTKSFGAMGGYIAGDKATIEFLRQRCAGSSSHNSLSPVVCQQVLSSFKVIMGEDDTNIGKQKITSLRDNSNYFRMRLQDMGLHVLGHYDSPIMPVMLYNPTKIAAFSRECFKRGLAVVVVGFPAVPILMSRARFCISAGHTREQLDQALEELEEIADILKIRYARSTFG